MRIVQAATVALVLLCTGLPASAQEAAPGSSARTEDFGWIAGEWRGEIGEDPIEETWSPPADGVMMGMFRWRGEKVLYEMLLIEQRDEGPVLVLRHFNRGLEAWEDETGALVFPLIEAGPNRVVFEREQDGKPLRLGYRRTGDQLVVTLTRTEDGKPLATDFTYERVP